MTWRFWKYWTQSQFIEAGERARQEHALWLTQAMRSRKPYPKIPLRAVDAGGFERLMHKQGGERLTTSWWEAAFARIDRVESRK